MGLFDKLKAQAMQKVENLQSQALQQVENLQSKLTGADANVETEDAPVKVSEPANVQVPPPPAPTPTPPPAPVAPQPQVTVQPSASQQNENNDGIYGNYLEHLIDMALADGELTEKEKQILFKKAEAHGIDLDEFEMVLDARLFEKQKAIQAENVTAHASAPKSDKYGDVRKCPSCGAIVESYTTRCPDCDYEFHNVESNASVQKLMKMLMAVDEQSRDVDIKSNFDVARAAFSQMYGFGPDRGPLKKKKTIINNFPIPTTKDDIIEFLTLAVPQAKTKGNFLTRNNPNFPDIKDHNDLAPAWKSKCEQIIMKARFSMKSDPQTLAQIEEYAKELNIK